MRQQEWHDANAPCHVHNARNHRCQHIASKLSVHVAHLLPRRVWTPHLKGCLGVERPIDFARRRFGDRAGTHHGCRTSRLVRAQEARLRDWRRTSGVMAAFQTK